MWYLIVSIPDLYTLTYFVHAHAPKRYSVVCQSPGARVQYSKRSVRIRHIKSDEICKEVGIKISLYNFYDYLLIIGWVKSVQADKRVYTYS